WLLLRLFFDGSGRLPLSLAKIIQLGATDFTFSLNLNFGDSRRVNWEDALDAFPVAYPPNGKVCVQPSAFAANHNPTVNLDTLFVPLDDPRVYPDGVSHLKLRDIFLELLALNFSDDAHSHSECGTCQPCATPLLWQAPFFSDRSILRMLLICCSDTPARFWGRSPARSVPGPIM